MNDTVERPTDSNNSRATARFVEGMKLLRSFQNTRDWKQLDTATDQFSEAVTIDPAYAAARFYLGVSQELGGKHDAAAQQFEEVKGQTLEPDPNLLYNLGLAYFHQYNPSAYRSAITYLTRVMELSKTPPAAAHRDKKQNRPLNSLRLLAEAALAQVHSHFSIPPKGVPDGEAQEHFHQALELGANSLKEFDHLRQQDQLEPSLVNDIGSGLHNALGHANLYAGRRQHRPEYLEKSIAEFTQALEFEPENYRVLSNLGSAHFFLAKQLQGQESAKELFVAEKFFHQVLRLKPQYDFAYTRLAQIALERGNWSEAEKYATQAKENPSEMTPEYLADLFEEIDRKRTASSSRSH